jgi:hypothetical protein
LFNDIGVNYALRKKGEQAGVQLELGRVQNDPAKAKGNTLTAKLNLGAVVCDGGGKQGQFDVQGRVNGTWTFQAEQTITYKAVIKDCGVISEADVKLESFDPFGGKSPIEEGVKTRNPGVWLIKSTYLPNEKLEKPPFPPK